jgi:hypothetical protein
MGRPFFVGVGWVARGRVATRPGAFQTNYCVCSYSPATKKAAPDTGAAFVMS